MRAVDRAEDIVCLVHPTCWPPLQYTVSAAIVATIKRKPDGTLGLRRCTDKLLYLLSLVEIPLQCYRSRDKGMLEPQNALCQHQSGGG